MIRGHLLPVVGFVWVLASIASAQETPNSPPPGWVREKIDLRAGPDTHITGIYRPADTPVARRGDRDTTPKVHRKAIAPPRVARQNATVANSPSEVISLIIDSPPLDGFAPWIAVVATDQKSGALELDGVPSVSVGGSVIHPQAQEADFAVGLFDTGAGVTIMGHAAAGTLGLIAANKLTPNTVAVTGVTGSVDALVSQPIGVYLDGLDAISPTTGFLDTTGMVGEYNISIAVGQTPASGQPDLPTAVGAPVAVYYAAVIENNQQVSRTVGGVTYQTPRMRFFQTDNPLIPAYPNLVPLELRPLGAQAVQYTPCLDLFGSCPGGMDAPTTPSIIMGTSSQSLYFLGSVDLYNGTKSALDKDRFMLDTGAQVSVVGNRVGARLGLNPNLPQFLVEVQGVDGQSIYKPGFFISSIQIPALGEWLTFNHVPVVLMDINSPEGGTLDGIIGMNLLSACNFVVRGGGMLLQPDPSLEFQIMAPLAVNCDFDHDGDVDMDDFGLLQQCFTGPDTVQSDPACAAARLDADSDVDADDLAIFTGCLSGANVPAGPECAE